MGFWIFIPKGLLRAVFFNNGISFCLLGGEEHRNLWLSQLKRENDPPRYVYTELASKNRAGGLAQLRVKNKSVTKFAVPEAVMFTSLTCTSANFRRTHLNVMYSLFGRSESMISLG